MKLTMRNITVFSLSIAMICIVTFSAKLIQYIAKTLEKHKESILGYFFAGVTNAVAEGINLMIQSAKRRARGYRTLDSYNQMIYLIASKLSLDCPPFFS